MSECSDCSPVSKIGSCGLCGRPVCFDCLDEQGDMCQHCYFEDEPEQESVKADWQTEGF